jgi:hypothetical protein
MSELNEINAILSASNIPAMAEQADRREREALAMRLAAQKQEAGFSQAAMLEKLKNKGGVFSGEGLSNQMYNILLDPNISEDDPRKIAAHEQLGKTSLVTMPDGTVVERQGIDTYAVSGGVRPEGEVLGTKPLSESEGLRAGQLELMHNINAGASNYIPSFSEGVSGYAPVGVDSWLQSEDYRKMMVDARAWSAVAAKLLYGAASDDEYQRVLENHWPEQGDTTEIIEQKAALRRSLEGTLQTYTRSPEGRAAGELEIIDFADLPTSDGK